MTELEEYLSTIKSKNAGPFKMSITLFFKNRQSYDEVLESGAINPKAISRLYGISENDIIGIYPIDRLNTLKISMERPVPSGDFYDSDLDGSQQHVRMLDFEIQ